MKKQLKLSSSQRPTKLNISFLYRYCLLYTSDAADERSSVDLGGRRIIKKKKNNRKWISSLTNANKMKQ